MTTSSNFQVAPRTRASFGATRWSVVLSARDPHLPQAAAALETLCGNYWAPLYAYLRRQGRSPQDAQDLTQEFFARLLQKNYLASVDRSKGKFRSFLLTALKHFLANEWDKARAQKRGGGRAHIPIDLTGAESSCVIDLADCATAEKAFERRWALTLLDRTLARLREEYSAEGKASVFEQLKSTLTGDRESMPYAQMAAVLKTSEGAVKVAAHRLRQRYREVLRAEIAETVSTRDEIEEELRSLFAALSK